MTPPFLFDDETARELLEALRHYQGRLQGEGRQLCPGLIGLRSIAFGSRRVPAGQPVADVHDGTHHAPMAVLLTYQDVGNRLQCSLSTVKRLVREGQLPTVRLGTAPRVRPDDLDAMVAALPTDTTAAA